MTGLGGTAQGAAQGGSTAQSKPAGVPGYAVVLLGVIGAIETAAPNINSSALISVSRDLGMSERAFALAASVQSMFIAATVISTGMLADRIGRRLVLSIALLIGAGGSALCAVAPNATVYMTGQAIIGIGLGGAYGCAFGYVRAVSPPGQLAVSLGRFSATIAMVSVTLTYLGSYLIGTNWRIGLASTAVASLLSVVLVRWLPKETRIPGSGVDLLGQALLALGIVAFLYGVSQLGRSLNSPATLIPLTLGIVLLAAFFIYEGRSPRAFYPVRLFRVPAFLAAVLAFFISSFGTAVAFLQTTNLWQYVTKVPARELALWQLPLLAAGILSPLMVGRLMGRGLAAKWAVLGNAIVTAIGFLLLAAASSATSFGAFLPGTVLVGAGVIGVLVPAGRIVIHSAPAEQYGPVTSSPPTIGQFWYSIGLAMSTVLVDRLTLGGVSEKLRAAGVQPDLVSTAVTSVDQFATTETPPSTPLAIESLNDAAASYASSFSTTMTLTAVLTLTAGVGGFALLSTARRPSPHPRSRA